MEASHHIEVVEIDPSFNGKNENKPWSSLQIGKVVPGLVVVLEPVGWTIPVTSASIQRTFGAQKASIIQDTKFNTLRVFLSNTKAVRSLLDKAKNLEGYKIFALDGEYRQCEDICGSVKTWIASLAQYHIDSEGLPAPIFPPSLPKTTPPAAHELDALVAFSDGEVNDIPELHYSSVLSDDDDDDNEELPTALGLGAGVAPATPTNRPTDDVCQRHDREVSNVLSILLATGPPQIRSNMELHAVLNSGRPRPTSDFDVALEGALWQAVLEIKKLKNPEYLNSARRALVSAWTTLGHGRLSGTEE